jgi:YedE family putative selenium metabolism protein
MTLKKKLFIVGAGLVFGILAALMVNWGNPPNMGVCIACFLRDISGALGLQQVATLKYIRPEIIGIVLGATITALSFREFRARGGSSPIIRFTLGAFVMIGALVFLGCPVRMLLRLAGGDLNGLPALGGLIVGVLVGIFFLRRGFSLGRSQKLPMMSGWIMPAMMVGLLLFAIFKPGFIYSSESGPGSMFAPLAVSIVVGLVIGFLVQRTRMCFVGGWRDLFLSGDTYLFSGLAAFFVAALVTNYAAGNFGAAGIYHWGFDGQPAAMTDHLWNFLGMTLVGLAVTLVGGCPLRQLTLTGEGDTDASVTVLGLVAGAALAHNFSIASSGKGTGLWGPTAVIIGLIFCVLVGFFMREKSTA